MKSILHLKDDTEYQIPLRETEKDDRAKVGTTTANPEVKAEKEAEKVDDKKKVDDEGEAAVTQSQDDPITDKKSNEISREEVEGKEKVNNENDSALEGLEDETKNQEPSNAENSSNTTTESTPPADTAKAALDEMKKLASQEGVIHPSLFISNFSKILGLMERAMQLQVKESGSATEESGSVTKEEAPKATEPTETTEKTEPPAGDKQGELNGNNRS